MSIVSQLIAAFKKGAEGKDPNWPPPPVGPRDVPGTDSPQDDGREFRNPPQDPLPPTGTGGVQPPVASGNNAETKAPPEPLPPSEPGPIEGDGGGAPTPPSAPFNPVEVVFKEADGGIASPDFKIEDSPVVEDPDAGGEVAASLKTNLDPAFTRRLRFASEEEPAPLTLKDAGDYKVEGIESASDGDHGDTDLAERRASLSDFKFTKPADTASPSLAGDDGGDLPNAWEGSKVEGLRPPIASSDQDRKSVV